MTAMEDPGDLKQSNGMCLLRPTTLLLFSVTFHPSGDGIVAGDIPRQQIASSSGEGRVYSRRSPIRFSGEQRQCRRPQRRASLLREVPPANENGGGGDGIVTERRFSPVLASFSSRNGEHERQSAAVALWHGFPPRCNSSRRWKIPATSNRATGCASSDQQPSFSSVSPFIPSGDGIVAGDIPRQQIASSSGEGRVYSRRSPIRFSGEQRQCRRPQRRASLLREVPPANENGGGGDGIVTERRFSPVLASFSSRNGEHERQSAAVALWHGFPPRCNSSRV
nr:hypothetical protein Iba_chr02eCG4900 [Ipomoea batatas]